MSDAFIVSALAVTAVAGILGWLLRKTSIPDELHNDILALVVAGSALLLPELSVEYALGAIGLGLTRRASGRGFKLKRKECQE